MLKRLHWKLSVAMLAIVLVLGGAFYAIDRVSVRLYYEELSQRLNASLAMYVTDAKPLVTDGEVDQAALAELANRAMVINPTAEIYLLDNDGNILGHEQDDSTVQATSVGLAPLQALLGGSDRLPIKGDDPKNPGVQKVFSVSPVMDGAAGGSQVGYLYVVLGGAQYEAVADQVADSYAQRTIFGAILMLVAAAFIVGVLVFSLMTRRLRTLTHDVVAYASDDANAPATIDAATVAQDEIADLRNACHSMAETIRAQMQDLRENDRLRRELVTNVSHDLRTPLASMQGYIETLLIKDQSLDVDTRRRYLEVARKHSQRLGLLVQDLFELAKLDSNGISPSLEQFPLTELIQDVLQEFELDARKANIELLIHPPQESVHVRADISLIQRVLENLVANALKFTPDGGTITIGVTQANGSVGVTVEDTGHGIAEEDLPKIFDRFYRAEHGEESRATSTGLGLAIAKRILDLHGSRISVTSRVAEGTRFEFDLPPAAIAA